MASNLKASGIHIEGESSVHSRDLAKQVAGSPDSGCDGQQSVHSILQLRSALKARRGREKFFASNLFADPAWDMLLHACVAQLEMNDTSISDLSRAAGVPLSTGLRWLSQLEVGGWMHHQSDAANVSQPLVRLTPKSIVAMRRYLASLQGSILPL